MELGRGRTAAEQNLCARGAKGFVCLWRLSASVLKGRVEWDCLNKEEREENWEKLAEGTTCSAAHNNGRRVVVGRLDCQRCDQKCEVCFFSRRNLSLGGDGRWQIGTWDERLGGAWGKNPCLAGSMGRDGTPNEV